MHNLSDQQWPHYIDKNLTNNHSQEQTQDLFTEKEGQLFAGTHILLDCWNASNLNNISHIENTLRKAVEVSGATLLHIHLHHFTPNGGVSGVAVLAESHISIHTWPERNFAALDIFMCGETQPEKAIAIFEEAFETREINLSKHLRGLVTAPDEESTQ